MLIALLLLVFLSSPTDVAGLKVELDAPAGAHVTILNGDQEIVPGTLYETPLHGKKTITLTIKWVDGDDVCEDEIDVELRSGYDLTIPIRLRAVPTVRLCHAPPARSTS